MDRVELEGILGHSLNGFAASIKSFLSLRKRFERCNFKNEALCLNITLVEPRNGSITEFKEQSAKSEAEDSLADD